uniref:Uncharacterized protein n=1 Tax=Dulem virus 40 TaxID=3145758 RepID=A0AAU8AUN1_9CAUD
MHWHGAIVPRGGSLTSPPDPSEEWDLFNSPYGLMPEEMQKAKLMEDYYEVAPAFSLSALLGLLPTSILSPMGDEYMLELSKLRMHDAWEVQWYNGRSRFITYDKQKKFCKLWSKSPIESCVKAIEWLMENGYKLNGIEKGGEV